MVYTNRLLMEYVKMVNAVPLITDTFTTEIQDEWQLVCKQPLAKSTHALIDLMGYWLPVNPTLVATTVLTVSKHVNRVTVKLYAENILHAETLGWSPGMPLNPDKQAHFSWAAWPEEWPLGKVNSQLSAMAETLFALSKIYADMTNDMYVNSRWSAEMDARELFTSLVGIKDEEMIRC